MWLLIRFAWSCCYCCHSCYLPCFYYHSHPFDWLHCLKFSLCLVQHFHGAFGDTAHHWNPTSVGRVLALRRGKMMKNARETGWPKPMRSTAPPRATDPNRCTFSNLGKYGKRAKPFLTHLDTFPHLKATLSRTYTLQNLGRMRFRTCSFFPRPEICKFPLLNMFELVSALKQKGNHSVTNVPDKCLKDLVGLQDGTLSLQDLNVLEVAHLNSETQGCQTWFGQNNLANFTSWFKGFKGLRKSYPRWGVPASQWPPPAHNSYYHNSISISNIFSSFRTSMFCWTGFSAYIHFWSIANTPLRQRPGRAQPPHFSTLRDSARVTSQVLKNGR